MTRLVATAIGLALAPSQLMASDFSGLMYVAYAVTGITALLIGLVAYFLTKDVRSIAIRASVWGFFIALVCTPLSTDGGNGRSSGPPLLDILLLGFGADPQYGVAALRALLVSAPICIGIVALFLWGRPRSGGAPDHSDGT
jgi:ABC-type branched-subunit amino acid transport system permease subunit